MHLQASAEEKEKNAYLKKKILFHWAILMNTKWLLAVARYCCADRTRDTRLRRIHAKIYEQ